MKIKFIKQTPYFEIVKNVDLNNRDIILSELNNVSLHGFNDYYPNPLLKQKCDDFYILPTCEKTMSLGCGTIYESNSMEWNYYEDKFDYNEILDPVYYFIYNTDNYYHFIYDTLPYLYCYLFHLKNKNVKLLMNFPNESKKHHYKFVEESLLLLGVDLNNVIIHNKNNKYNKMYIQNSLTHDGLSNFSPRKEIYEIYNLMKDNSIDINCPEKVYVSRRTWMHNDLTNLGTNYTTRRKLMNEDELVTKLIEKGFTEIFCENLSMAEKIKLFSSAKIIVGAIGGGMCNLLFSDKKTKTIVLNSPYFMEINERFKYSMEHTKIIYFNDTYLDCQKDTLPNYVRVKIGNKIGEIIEHVENDKYKIAIGNGTNVGFNLNDNYEIQIIDKSRFEVLDKGLNSPWIINLEELLKII